MAQERPAHEIRLGRIRVAIWANKNGQDKVWFNVTMSRSYSDADGWKDSSSYRRDDLPIAAKAMEMAYGWIWKHESASAPVEQES